MFQNHLLQVLALLAMEPPVGHESSYLQDEKVKVLAATEPLDCNRLVRGQYTGYKQEPGVAKGSRTETFVAATMHIDSWRWADVPWYVRVGKGLAQAATEAVIELASPPRMLFDESGGTTPERNLIRLRMGKRDGVTMNVQAKTPGPELDSQAVDLSVDFAAALGERREPYERLLSDALTGSPRRFARGHGRTDVAHRRPGPQRMWADRQQPGPPVCRRFVGTQAGRLAAAPGRPLVRPVGLTADRTLLP